MVAVEVMEVGWGGGLSICCERTSGAFLRLSDLHGSETAYRAFRWGGGGGGGSSLRKIALEYTTCNFFFLVCAEKNTRPDRRGYSRLLILAVFVFRLRQLVRQTPPCSPLSSINTALVMNPHGLRGSFLKD